MSSNFTVLYERLYKKSPFPYQTRFATRLASDAPPNTLGVPTGCGKESAAIAAFIYQWQTAKRWRRLAYTLPTRALVAQVLDNTEEALRTAGLYLEQNGPPDPSKFKVWQLMGGAVDRDWVEDPEQPCILIGTQDQLLSRALNRGYSLSPYRWPIDFGLLSQDTLWVFDETQLMAAGFDTSIQLQGLRDAFSSFQETHSVWLSATLDTGRLARIADYQRSLSTIDLSPDFEFDPVTQEARLPDEATEQHKLLAKRLKARKALHRWETSAKDVWAALAADAVNAAKQGKVLVVVNQVKRAQAIAQALDKLGVEPKPKLVHSRFREGDRPSVSDLKDFAGIVVATQAIEAGVDLDAVTLFTELCPWSSLVQRVGRCNRRGEANDRAAVYWLDVKDTDALPYEAGELAACRAVLESTDEIGIAAVKRLQAESQLQPKLEATPIPRRKDLLELFHTDEDLQGSRTDVNPFVRGLKDEDVQLGWREFQDRPDPERGQLCREELCRVRIGTAKKFLEGKSAYLWNSTQGHYETANPWELRPGMAILLPCAAGGYHQDWGFTGSPSDKPSDLQLEPIAHESSDGDRWSQRPEWVTLQQHSQDVAAQCRHLAELLLPESVQADFERAGRWHDYGKAHPEWQCTVVGQTDLLYAKVAKWGGVGRRGIRHELASMLVARQMGESPLIQYLVLCHHGKVRTCIEPWPTEAEKGAVRGICEGDRIEREVDLGDGLVVPPQTLQLEAVAYWSGDWTDDVDELLEEYGPFKLAYLEALLRMADWRASRAPGAVGPEVAPPKQVVMGGRHVTA